jgi:lipoprotein-releasing system ATP-binding protein
MNDQARVAALTLDSVERRYGRGDTTVEVLNGASLELAPSQSVALIAPSGAGKSTLLHLAGLLERRDAGEVRIGGAATSTMSDDKRTALRRTEIGFVYQFHHLLPEPALQNRPAADDRGAPTRPGRRPRTRTSRLSWSRSA